MEKKTKTVTIVWWGIGWLASAILLAKQWYKVSLFEKNECLGGRASIMHKDGYTFDMGPSRYLMPDIFEEFFKSIDEDIHDYLDLKQLSPSYRVFYEKGNQWNYNNDVKFWVIEDHLDEVAKLYEDCFCGDQFWKLYTKEYFLKSYDNWKQEKDYFWRTLLIRNEFAWFCRWYGHHKDAYINEIWWKEYIDKIFANLWIEKQLIYRFDDACIKKEFRWKWYYKELVSCRISFARNKFYKYIAVYTAKSATNTISMFTENGFKIIWEFNNLHSSSEYVILIKNINSLDYLNIYADSKRMSDIFESMEPWAGKQFLTFLDRAKIQYEIGMEFCKKNYDSIFDFFRRDIMRKGIKLNIRTTIDKYVARFFKNQLIRKIMQYTTVFLGTAPKQTPALYNIMSHCDFNMWVRYPKGGLHEIAKALHTIWLKYGVEYHLNTEVVWSEIKDNQIQSLMIQSTALTKSIQTKQSILIINNHSKHIHELEQLIQNNDYAYKTISSSDIWVVNVDNFDCVILSWWSYLRPVSDHPEDYTDIANFIMQCNKPIIWICLGAQIIAHTYCSTLSELEEKIEGLRSITIDWTRKHIRTVEHHRFAIKQLGPDFSSIAHSDYGIEIFKHDQKEIYGFQYHPECNTNNQQWDEVFLDVLDRLLRRDIADSKAPRNDGLKQTIQSDIYLINADMAWFETSVLPKESQTHPKSYRDRKIFAPSGFIIYAWVNKKLPKLDHHNLYFCEDRDKNFGQIFDTKELPDNPSIYVSKITHTDPTMAPEWCENLFILVPIPNGIEISDNQKVEYKNMVRGIVEQMAGEDLVWHISVEEIFTVDNFKSRYNSWKWTALWLAHPIMQTAVFRPNNISKKLDNLFYVWHNTNPGIGVPMVIISAKLALERIMKKFTL